MKKSKATRTLLCAISVLLVMVLLAGCSAGAPMMNGAANAPMGGYLPEDSGKNYQYDQIKENGFTTVDEKNNTSTFSLDRNTASYALMRSQINQGLTIAEDSVRIEEYINYFNYDYARPENAEALAISGKLADCPWNAENKIFSIGIAAETIEFENAKPNNIVFLLDVSGSMYGADRLGLIQQAFTMLLEHLKDEDTVSIVTYAGSTAVLLDGARGYEKTKIAAILQDLEASGSTAGAKGIQLAYDTAQKYYSEDKNNRVILATDGDFNVGISSTSALKEFIAEKRDSGIYLSVLGVGMHNTNDSTMKTLAENGNGNYAYLDTVTEARKVLVGELGGTMNVVAKNAKINITFNPETVAKFRLIGYESKMMSVEDFEDENKDAGEIGAGHTVTAIYEIQLVPEAQGQIASAEIRYQTPDTASENKSISKDFTTDDYTDTADEDLAFIACVAEYGLVLRNSEYRGDATLGAVISRLEELQCTKDDQFKAEFLEIVKKAQENMK